jgi:hypothetical protein
MTINIEFNDVTELENDTKESDVYETQKTNNESIIEKYKTFVNDLFYNDFERKAKSNKQLIPMLNILKYVVNMINDSINTLEHDEKRVNKQQKEQNNSSMAEMGIQNPAIKHLKQAKDTYIKTSERFIGLIKTLVSIVKMTNEKDSSIIQKNIKEFKNSIIKRARESAEVTKSALENSAKSVKEIGRIRDAMQRSMMLAKSNIKIVIQCEQIAIVIHELIKIYAEFIKTKLTTSQEEITDSIRVAKLANSEIDKIDKITDDPEYFNKYYREHLSLQINCPLCSALVSKAKMKRHQSRNICVKKQQINLV